jgi:hypothetical protein
MDRVEEIESAIDALAPDEFRRIAQWFHTRDHEQWDRQIDADSQSGKLDFLFDEADDRLAPARSLESGLGATLSTTKW